MGTRVSGAAAVVLAVALACNGGLEPTPVCGTSFVGICGTVTFQGQEPESTQGVFIVAYPTFPQSRTDLLNNFLPRPPLQSLLRPFTSQQSYAVQLPSGRYEWVLAVWLKQGAVPTPTNADTVLREAGFYRDDTDPAQPGIVTVPGGARTDSIDFVIDFGNMRRVCDYFPPCPP